VFRTGKKPHAAKSGEERFGLNFVQKVDADFFLVVGHQSSFLATS
jgi:hypothetical protein